MPVNNLIGRVLLISSAFTLLPAQGLTFCMQPSFWDSGPSFFWSPPSVPYCLSAYSYTGEHTCSSWEIDSYVEEINEYVEALNGFVREAQSFAESAQVFAEDVINYAVCEAEAVRTQHE